MNIEHLGTGWVTDAWQDRARSVKTQVPAPRCVNFLLQSALARW